MLGLLTAFTGSIIGLEQPVVPLLGHERFHLTTNLALLSFIVSFGVAKAVANLFAGRLCDRFGRRRVLLAGWTLGLAEPLLIIWAPNWSWVVAANLLLGIQQGLCWTTAIAMMVDRSRPDSHGLATGINELAGYGGQALAGLGAGYLAGRFGLRPAPFLPSLALIAGGMVLTARRVEDTVRLRVVGRGWLPLDLLTLPFRRIRGDLRLLLCSQGGLIVNLLQALITGLIPVHLVLAHHLRPFSVALVIFAYLFSCGIAQGATGALSDVLGRRVPIAAGMAAQGMALMGFVASQGMAAWCLFAALMGIGRALAYPTLLAAVADDVPDRATATSLGVYRFYRDSGYWVGGLAGGAAADLIGIPGALVAAGAVAMASGAAVLLLPRPARARRPAAAVIEAGHDDYELAVANGGPAAARLRRR